MELPLIISGHWIQLRGMSYDLLDLLEADDLKLKLDFERSQALGYQFWCMLGAQESWISLLASGEWRGFSCSVNAYEGDDPIGDFARQMQVADEALLRTVNEGDLTQTFADGKSPLSYYLTLVEHESHHQGQLINFIYAHDLAIPRSWEAKWNLKRQ